jgi:heme-degrading monooxygenase HmoA
MICASPDIEAAVDSSNNMAGIAVTPEPPYYAVIFTSLRAERGDPGLDEAYVAVAERMLELAAEQPGYLGVESVRDGLGITVSYWRDLPSIAAWKRESEHRMAQQLGREHFYSAYRTRVCRVERDYSFEQAAGSFEL